MSAQLRSDAAGLDWENLRFFLALARGGSLSEAARSLRVDHTTVARRIARLEATLGAQLFDRGRRGYDLTAQAAGLVETAERIEAEVLALERQVAGRDMNLAGTVHLTTVESLATRFLIPALPEFRAAHPRIALHLVADTRVLNLTRREADLALRLSRPQDGGLVARRLSDIGYGLYAAERYLAARPLAGAIDLAQHDFVAYDEGLAHLPQERWLTQQVARPRYALRVNSAEALLAGARAGLGLVVLPGYMVAPQHALVRLAPPQPLPARALWLLVHGELRRAPRVRAVMDWLGTLIERNRAVLAGE